MATNEPAALGRVKLASALRGIYVILNEQPQTMHIARAVLDAGVRILQYRAKDGIAAENLRALRQLTRRHGALLIMNDDWRAAEEFGCDGVHLGPDDEGYARVAPVRAALRDRLIGLSCGTIEEVARADTAGADYLGIGCVYETRSKSDAGAPIGIGGLRALARRTALPVAAIGGINPENLSEVRAAGVAMAAVISTVSGAPDPGLAARELVGRWENVR